MKTLASSLATAAAATQAGWAELYDIYLKSAITTPQGVTNILRLTTLPAGFAFFAPLLDPEPIGTRGAAASYLFWPLKRGIVKASAKSTNDKLSLVASNVSTGWAQMIAAIDWYDTPVVIRKVPIDTVGLTSADCGIGFSGLVDSAGIDDESISLTLSSDLATFAVIKPAENMHENCRFAWADDMCSMIRFHANHYKSKTVGSGSTTSVVIASGLTEDTGARGSYGTDLVNALANAAVTASSFSPVGKEGYRVRAANGGYWNFDAPADWGTLTSGYWKIPDAQAGLRNAALTPWIQFDFGVARACRVWQFIINSSNRAQQPRLIEIFSSPNGTTWTFESYFQVPPRYLDVIDCYIPSASSNRYWRICIRNRWQARLSSCFIKQISAYEGGRHYWRDGWICFDPSTTTVALRGVSRLIQESYSGELTCGTLPSAPVSGDIFTIERGCGRTFNDCCARGNVENFGGFTTLPLEEAEV